MTDLPDKASWTPPPVTDEQLRAAGFTAQARQFPRSEAGARWIAAFNGVPFEKVPAAWCYASNAWMLDYVETQAADEKPRAPHGQRG